MDVFDNHQDEAGEIRVRFGEGLTQTMPLDWAEHILSSLKETRASEFGKLLAAAALAAK